MIGDSNTDRSIEQWRLQILNGLLWVLVAAGGIALLAGAWADYTTMGEQALPYIAMYAAGYAGIVVTAVWRQLPLTARAVILLIILGLVATLLLIGFGLIGSGRLIWLGVTILATVFFGNRGGIIGLSISLLVMIAVAGFYVTGNVTFVSAEALSLQDEIADWAGSIALYVAATLLALVPFTILMQRLSALARHATTEAARAQLHARLAEERAKQLSEQTEQLQATERMLRNLVQSLETPAVELARDILLAPIVGQIDRQRAEAILKHLLEVVSNRRIRMVVIDVAGVPAFDTLAAQSLIQTAQALRLIGCEAVITGISPSMAQTITALGIDMETVNTARSPQDVLIRLSAA